MRKHTSVTEDVTYYLDPLSLVHLQFSQFIKQLKREKLLISYAQFKERIF